MTRAKSAERTPSAVPALGNGPELLVYVIYTNPDGTFRALQTAGELACGLGSRIVLLFARVVPYPLPLECPDVAGEFTGDLLREVGGGEGVECRVYLCRDREDALRRALTPGSLVVMGARKRWRPDQDRRLARMLRRDGHAVIFAGVKRATVDSSGAVKV